MTPARYDERGCREIPWEMMVSENSGSMNRIRNMACLGQVKRGRDWIQVREPCPIMGWCLEDAMRMADQHSQSLLDAIYGGMTPSELRAEFRRRRRERKASSPAAA